MASEVFDAGSKITRGTQIDSPQRIECDVLHDVLSAFCSAMFEAVEEKTIRGGENTMREVFSDVS